MRLIVPRQARAPCQTSVMPRFGVRFAISVVRSPPAADGAIIRAALYNEQADRRSRASMKSLFDDVLT
ncbi:hypothetical protein CQ12_21125 [Bradyrhizobium jicamae]|uniref:Uncharacterized protein n=1 Tax=Bradyrhizobium jicamae TaxID=280332 RepID=A0A0R3LFU9_9BRAD|nr:hypothetical protein CQ12_21125 [Bradyrhizobium jicamae]